MGERERDEKMKTMDMEFSNLDPFSQLFFSLLGSIFVTNENNFYVSTSMRKRRRRERLYCDKHEERV